LTAMEELAIIRDVARRLEDAGLPYMLTGSLAMSFYAQPRMTRDIDVVVEINPRHAETIRAIFEKDYLVSSEAIHEAVEHRSMFNLIHQETLTKIDVIVRKDEPYRRLEFERRRKVPIDGDELCVVSKEDLILSKLWWARDSRSEVQLRDVQNLLDTGYDKEYLDHWLHELELYDLARPFLG
jgi:predicted nucleotidyltransferase